jgi:hypothetical protein
VRDREFGAILMVVSVIIIGTAIFFNTVDSTPETTNEGRVEAVEYVDFEPMEINVPITHYDFSDEEPMLITPDMAD